MRVYTFFHRGWVMKARWLPEFFINYGVRTALCLLVLGSLIFAGAYDASAVTLRGQQTIEIGGAEHAVVDSELQIEGCPFVFKKGVYTTNLGEEPEVLTGTFYVPESCKTLYLSGKSNVTYTGSLYKYNSTAFGLMDGEPVPQWLLKTSEDGSSVSSWSYTMEAQNFCYGWAPTGECMAENFEFLHWFGADLEAYVTPWGQFKFNGQHLGTNEEITGSPGIAFWIRFKHVQNLNVPEVKGCPTDNPYIVFDGN